MSTTDDQLVWVRTGTVRPIRTYHEDETCPNLAKAITKRQKELGVLHDDIEPCRVCTSERDDPDEPSDAYYRAVNHDLDET